MDKPNDLQMGETKITIKALRNPLQADQKRLYGLLIEIQLS